MFSPFTTSPFPSLNFPPQQFLGRPALFLRVLHQFEDCATQGATAPGRPGFRLLVQQSGLARLLQKFFGTQQGRQMFRDAIQRRRPLMPLKKVKLTRDGQNKYFDARK